MLDVQAQSHFQGVNCNRTFIDGSLHQIRLRVTILHVVFIIREQPIGSFKVVSLESGKQLVPYCGFTESVCSLYHFHLLLLITITRSGIRQKCPLVRRSQTM